MLPDAPFRVVVNARTHLVVENSSGRCLGAVGFTFYRPWVFPLYTPAGLTILQEFPYDHPFHNGCFVGQSPVRSGTREGNFWYTPPRQSLEEPGFVHIGRMEAKAPFEIRPHERGIRFSIRCIWRDEQVQPLLDELRTVDLYRFADATLCDVISEKVSAYEDVEYPQTKHGGIGVRVEPRLLLACGGRVLGDGGRAGGAEVVHGLQSDYVAYENAGPDGRPFGVFLQSLEPSSGTPWFVRDYGLALLNPTQQQSLRVPRGSSWVAALRVAAYDGALTDARAREWMRGQVGSG